MKQLLSNLPQLVKKYLGQIPDDDYPVLNSFLFVTCWLNFALDPGVDSMRGMFAILNQQGIKVDFSTFSKASKSRDSELFENILNRLIAEVKKKTPPDKLVLFPLDSTVITVMSKLLWQQNIYQVKLFSGINLTTGGTEGIYLHFGQGHDSKHGKETIDAIPENGVGIMDRGFAALKRIRQLLQEPRKFFVIRLKNDISLELKENELFKVGKGKEAVEVRVVAFCDVETQTEYRLATNLPATGEFGVDNEEVGEIYRQRWGIELLWKFLKMHLKLARLITKNVNGITIQIYACLIAYLLLQLLEIPKDLGNKLLDKFRYLQAFMRREISYVHWFGRMVLAK